MQAGTRAELVRPRPLARPELARALAGDVAERASERAQAVPARLERDLGDGQVRVAQQRRRPLDATREQVAVRRQTPKASLNDRAKCASETPLTRASRRTGHSSARGRVHPVLRAQQAAQQLGVLACMLSSLFAR